MRFPDPADAIGDRCLQGRGTTPMATRAWDKRQSRGRIDAMQAAVMAVGLGRRWRLASPDSGKVDLVKFYQDPANFRVMSV